MLCYLIKAQYAVCNFCTLQIKYQLCNKEEKTCTFWIVVSLLSSCACVWLFYCIFLHRTSKWGFITIVLQFSLFVRLHVDSGLCNFRAHIWSTYTHCKPGGENTQESLYHTLLFICPSPFTPSLRKKLSSSTLINFHLPLKSQWSTPFYIFPSLNEPRIVSAT